jgi:pSer/pThr/pTyr-binding forkhead associated (FHA) protein
LSANLIMVTTQLQGKPRPKLLHIQSNTFIELPPDRSVIYIGKPDGRIPPDIDVSKLPNANVVSRTHVKISVEEGRFYYIEDEGSSNGTFLNRTLLTPHERRQLKFKDKIDFGKENNFTLEFIS